jgi:hypothetical protein
MPTDVAQRVFESLTRRLQFMQRMVALLIASVLVGAVVATILLVTLLSLSTLLNRRTPVINYISASEAHADCVVEKQIAFLSAIGEASLNREDPTARTRFEATLADLDRIDVLCPPVGPAEQQD